jgi:hypothetical protein
MSLPPDALHAAQVRAARATHPSPREVARLQRRAARLLRSWTIPAPGDFENSQLSERLPRDPRWWPPGTPAEIQAGAAAAGFPGAQALFRAMRRLQSARPETITPAVIQHIRWALTVRELARADWAARQQAAGLPPGILRNRRGLVFGDWDPVPNWAHLALFLDLYDEWTAVAQAPDLAALRERDPVQWLRQVNSRLRFRNPARWERADYDVLRDTPITWAFPERFRSAAAVPPGADPRPLPTWRSLWWPGNWARWPLVWALPATLAYPIWVASGIGVVTGFLGVFPALFALLGSGWGPFLLQNGASAAYVAAFLGRDGPHAAHAAWALAALRATEFSGPLALWAYVKRVILNAWW